MGIQHLKYPQKLLSFNQRRRYLINLCFSFEFVSPQLTQQFSLRHISLN